MTTKTYAELGTLSSISGNFLIAAWDPAGPGPLKTAQASVCKTYFNSTNGTAAGYNIGTSGANVPLMNGANTWSAAQTFSLGIVGNLTGTASAVADGAVSPAKLSTGGPAWNTGGDVTLTGRLIIGGASGANFRDDGTSVSLFFSSDTYLQWIPGSNEIALVKGGTTVATW
jgi:hypothetical protein